MREPDVAAELGESAARLTAIAAYALAGEDSSRAELQPVRWALYSSRVVPGADETAVVIQLHGAPALHGGTGRAPRSAA